MPLPNNYLEKLMRDPAFRRWFGESKIVDRRSGLPRVMYHGTGENIGSFQGANANVPGFFSPSPKLASAFAKTSAGAIDDIDDPAYANVIPTFLSAKNPYDFRVPSHRKMFGISQDADDAVLEDHDLVKAMKSRGFDSLYTREPGPSAGRAMNVGIFDPRQAKSVFNRGTWDPSDPHISRARGGRAKMDWGLHDKMGSGRISVLGVRRDPVHGWVPDDSDPLSLSSARGQWWKSPQSIDPSYLGIDQPVTNDVVRNAIQNKRRIFPQDFTRGGRVHMAPGGYTSVAKALEEGSWRPPFSRVRRALKGQRGVEGQYNDLYSFNALGRERRLELEEKLRDELRRSELSMRAEPVALRGILADAAIKNQHETGTSRGYLGPDVRKMFEQKFFGYAPDVENRELPKYGYAFNPLGTLDSHGVDSYGQLRLHLDPDLRRRSTVFFGDSLNSWAAPSPYLSPRRISFDSLATRTGEPKAIDALLNVLEGRRTAQSLAPLYTEAQIHGPLPASAIKGVTAPANWMRNDPEYMGSLKEMLEQHGIPLETTHSYDYASGGLAQMRQCGHG